MSQAETQENRMRLCLCSRDKSIVSYRYIGLYPEKTAQRFSNTTTMLSERPIKTKTAKRGSEILALWSQSTFATKSKMCPLNMAPPTGPPPFAPCVGAASFSTGGRIPRRQLQYDAASSASFSHSFRDGGEPSVLLRTVAARLVCLGRSVCGEKRGRSRMTECFRVVLRLRVVSFRTSRKYPTKDVYFCKGSKSL